jgi:BMFP domain-containing protein YqiC
MQKETRTRAVTEDSNRIIQIVVAQHRASLAAVEARIAKLEAALAKLEEKIRTLRSQYRS